jgi:hypothetical protein
MNKRLALIGGGAVLLLTVGYFGLSAYSSKEAQKRLEDWSYDVELDDKLSWVSVSASPFGGRVSISDLELDLGKNQPTLRAAEVVISELVKDDEQTRVRLRFRGIEADSAAFANLRDLGVMAGRGIDRGLARAAHGFEPALNSGLVALKPFDLELFVDIDDDAGTVETEFLVSLPELFDTRFSYRLSNQRGLNRQLSRLESDLADADNIAQFLSSLESLANSLERAEIASVRASFRDRGMVERSIALQQRYNTPLDPTAGSADKQRAAHYEKQVLRIVKECEREVPVKSLDNACELLGKVMLGKEDGLELSLKPSERVRLQDLAKFDNPRTGKRLLERLNPRLDSL